MRQILLFVLLPVNIRRQSLNHIENRFFNICRSKIDCYFSIFFSRRFLLQNFQSRAHSFFCLIQSLIRQTDNIKRMKTDINIGLHFNKFSIYSFKLGRKNFRKVLHAKINFNNLNFNGIFTLSNILIVVNISTLKNQILSKNHLYLSRMNKYEEENLCPNK